MMRGPYKAQSVTIGVTNTRAQLRNNGYMLEAGGHIPARCIYKAARFIKAFNYMVALTVLNMGHILATVGHRTSIQKCPRTFKKIMLPAQKKARPRLTDQRQRGDGNHAGRQHDYKKQTFV